MVVITTMWCANLWAQNIIHIFVLSEVKLNEGIGLIIVWLLVWYRVAMHKHMHEGWVAAGQKTAVSKKEPAS